MTKLTVGWRTVVDALDRKFTGWIVIENGIPSKPHKDRDAAIRAAQAIAEIRGQSPSIVQVEPDPISHVRNYNEDEWNYRQTHQGTC